MKHKKLSFPNTIIQRSIFWINRHRWFCVACILFLIFMFLRFFDLETRAVFGFDQITNSWVMKNMILDGKRPLLGMVAKGNSGFYIGPAYYYLLSVFYWFFDLDPIAGMVFAGVVSCVTFWVLYMVANRIFGDHIAVISLFIYTCSCAVIESNRIPWPVVFIPLTSLLTFFCLYRVLQGKTRYLILLATVIGFAFHTHFTAVYYVVIVLLCAPFIFAKKNGLKHSVIATPFFLFWLIPNIISEFQTHFGYGNNMAGYLQTYFHGFHLVRVSQLINDAVIEFEAVLFFKQLRFLHIIIPIIFILLVSLYEKGKRSAVLLLFFLWIIIPWFVMATYRGEISDYYFIITQPIAVITLAYLSYWIIRLPCYIPGIALCIFGLYWASANIQRYLTTSFSKMSEYRETAKKAVRENRKIEFSEWVPEPYLYELYLHRKRQGKFPD